MFNVATLVYFYAEEIGGDDIIGYGKGHGFRL